MGGRALGAAYLGGRHHRDLFEVVVRHACDQPRGMAARTSAGVGRGEGQRVGGTSAEVDGTSASFASLPGAPYVSPPTARLRRRTAPPPGRRRGHGAGGGAEGVRRAGGRPRGGSGFDVQSLTLKERVLRGLPGGLCSPRRSPAPGPGRDPLPARIRGLGSLGVSGWSEGLGRLRGPRGVWDLEGPGGLRI